MHQYFLMKTTHEKGSIVRFTVKICIDECGMDSQQSGNIEVDGPDVITGSNVILNIHTTEKAPG